MQYAKMVDGLAKLPGYERGVSIRGAPYDYRCVINNFYVSTPFMPLIISTR